MLTVIGCGNPNRRDDGVGVVIAQRLAAELTETERRLVSVVDAGTDGMGVLLRLETAGALILVDASRSGAEPGSIYEVPGAELENPPAPSFNLHDFRWDHALYAGRKMFGDRFPREISVFLIEAEDLSFGLGLSEPVERAAAWVTERIRERIALVARRSEEANETTTSIRLALRHGSLLLPVAIFERYFSGLHSVLLLPRERSLLILPVRNAGGGGNLLKIVNPAGDRAVSGVELFRLLGVDEELIDGYRESTYEARWDAEAAALVIENFFCETSAQC
ncbi:MAG TPA: hydrogenase maturation protease [Thermoanaerobaculia bacterium]|nr:hydrogenase maturation protease [Thermoanaerobaculia bacterium]